MKASFDAGRRTATGAYVYQYDRGQTLEVYGLEGITEAGTVTTVQFAFATDAQAISVTPTIHRGVLEASIPDEILQEQQEARAYIYVARGENVARTMYEVIFTPIARPAPANRVPIEVNNEWDALRADIAQHIDATDAAAGRANAAAASLAAEHIMTETARREISVPVTGWVANAQGWQEKTVDCAGTVVSSAVQRVDVAVLGEQIGNVLLAGARVDANDKLTLVCLAVPPVAFELAVVISEVKTIGKA